MRLLLLLLLLALAGCGASSTAGSPPAAPTHAPVGTLARDGQQGAAAVVNHLPVVLNAGWNPVGFQAQRLTGLAGTSQVAGQASWNGSAYVTGNLDLASVNGRLGYWVFAREATTFTYSGADDGAGDFVDLVSGYNLVSFCTNLEIATSSLVTTRSGQVVPLNSVLLTQFFELQTNNTLATLEVPGGALKPGRAYWVFAREPVRLSWGEAPSPSPSPSASPSPAASPATPVTPGASPSPAASPLPGASPVATRLLFTSVPNATAGVAANYGVQVQDQYGHPVPGVTVGLTLHTSPAGATLSSTPSSTGSVSATFTKAGTTYTLRASAAGLPDALSNSFTVASAAPARLGFADQPRGGVRSSFIQPVTVALFDAFDNLVPNPGAALPVTVTGTPGVLGPNVLSLGTGASSVSFGGLVAPAPGNYTLSASASGFADVTTSVFPVVDDTGLRLLPFNFSGHVMAGRSSPLVVGFFDSSGNPLTTQTGTITVSAAGLPTLSAAAVNGFATFTLQPLQAGSYPLYLSSPGAAVAPLSLVVFPGPLASMVFSTQPGTLSSGASASVAVTALDAYGNVKTDANAPVRFQLGTGVGPFTPAFGVFSSGVASASFRLAAAQVGAILQAVYLGAESVPTISSNAFSVNREQAPSLTGSLGSLGDAWLSGSGRYVTFPDFASGQILVRDRYTDNTMIASLRDGTSTIPAGASSQSGPQVSDDGSTVVFVSDASNLVPGYSGGGSQIYLRKLTTGRTFLVSRSSASATAGGNGNSSNPRLSADGTRVAFETEATNLMATGSLLVATLGPSGVASVTAVAGQADAPCSLRGMSSDGAAILFRTAATNLGGPALGPAANARLFLADSAGLRFVAQTDSFGSLPESGLADSGVALWGAGVDPQTGVADGAGQALYRLSGGVYTRLVNAQALCLAVDRTGARAIYFDQGSFTVPVVDVGAGAVLGTLPDGNNASAFQAFSLAAGGGLGCYLGGVGSPTFLISPTP